MAENILIIVAHSDDESISMGGTIRRHVSLGDQVYAVSMTNGVGAREKVTEGEISERKQASNNASKILGFDWGMCFNFKDNEMDTYPLLEVVKAVEQIKLRYRPTLVYTHSAADLNIDHRVVSNAVITAFRPQPNEICREIRLFEVASATDYGSPAITGSFSPNLFIDITEEWSLKAEALSCYSSEMREYPHSRSIQGVKNLAKLRGNQVGFHFAEAFEVLRKLVD